MPIWLEMTVLMLASYGAGLAAGWLVWAKNSDHDIPAAGADTARDEDTTT